MAFYDQPKIKRKAFVDQIHRQIQKDLADGTDGCILNYFADEDTYIRKAAYLAVGKIYSSEKTLRKNILARLKKFAAHSDEKIRQTVVNAAGEIGKTDFETIQEFMDKALFDAHHIVRNAVIGSIKKMGEKNPAPVLAFAKKYLHHEDKEIRREICHGIELRGRTHPQDILPLLRELQHDETSRVANTLVHVIGQISYKKGCLEIVVNDLKTWENKKLVAKALAEIVDVHNRYKNFSFYTQSFAKDHIETSFQEMT